MSDVVKNIGEITWEEIVGGFLQFMVKYTKKHFAEQHMREHWHTRLCSIGKKIENLSSYSAFCRYFSEEQIARLEKTLTSTARENISLLHIEQRCLDCIKPSIADQSQINSAIQELIGTLFELCNALPHEDVILLNQFDRQLDVRLREVEENVDKRIAELSYGLPKRAQIQEFSVESFLESKRKSPINADLHGNLISRADELQTALACTEPVLLLYGHAGVGKTRLALEIVRQIAEVEQREVICISPQNTELSTKLNDLLQPYHKYLMLIDDVNEVTNLSVILYYLTYDTNGINVRAVMTVRDYAVAKVRLDILHKVKLREMHIKPMTHKQLEVLLQTKYEAFSSVIIEEVLRLAKGNPRMALMAAECVLREQNLKPLRDATDLYDVYYRKILADNPAWLEQENLCTAAIVAIIGSIDLENVQYLEPLLNALNLNKDRLVESVRQLNKDEILDLYLNRGVKLPDQCLGDYLIKKVLLDEQLIPLEEFIDCCFRIHPRALSRLIEMLRSHFDSQSICGQVTTAVRNVWNRMEESGDLRLNAFVERFHFVDPEKTLLIIHDYIEALTYEAADAKAIDFEKQHNDQRISDTWLSMLVNYCHYQARTAIQLILRYYAKRPGLYMQIYHALCKIMEPDEYAKAREYLAQKELAKQMSELLAVQSSDNNDLLCGRIAMHMLNWQFQCYHVVDDRRIVFQTICLSETADIREYRNVFWHVLSSSVKNGLLHSEILRFLMLFGRGTGDMGTDILMGDLPNIVQFVKEICSVDSVEDVYAIKRLYDHLIKCCFDEKQVACLIPYFTSAKYIIVQMLTEEIYHREVEKVSYVVDFAKKMTTDDIPFLLATFRELKGNNEWNITSNFRNILKALDDRQELQWALIQAYWRDGAVMGIPLADIWKNQLKYRTAYDILEALCNETNEESCYVILDLLSVIPPEMVTDAHVHYLIESFRQTQHFSGPRDLRFILNYKAVQADIVPIILSILSDKAAKNPLILDVYAPWLFDESGWLIVYCCNEFDLVVKVYLQAVFCGGLVDYSGSFLRILAEKAPYVLQGVLQQLPHPDKANRAAEILAAVMTWDNSPSLWQEILNMLFSQEYFPFYWTSSEYLAQIAYGQDNRCTVDEINARMLVALETCRDDCGKLDVLFQALTLLPQECRRNTILVWLKGHPTVNVLNHISLCKLSYCGPMSELATIKKNELDLMERILSELDDGIDDLLVRRKVQQEIDILRMQIIEDKLGEYLFDA